MNKIKLFLLLVVASMMVSCLDRAGSDFAPAIGISQILLNRTDTLSLNVDDKGVYQLDTINVGDTVNYALVFEGYSQDIISIVATLEGTSVSHEFIIDDAFKAVLLDESDIENGKLYFREGYVRAVIPNYIIAKKTGFSQLSYEFNTKSKFSPATASMAIVVR